MGSTAPRSSSIAGWTVPGVDSRGAGSPHLRRRRVRRTAVPRMGLRSRPLSERCISYGAPRTGVELHSTADHSSTRQRWCCCRMIHDARVVPMTNKPHLPKKIRQLPAIRAAAWEGDTLVVETTNYINGSRDRRRTSDHRTLHARQPRLHQLASHRRDPATWTSRTPFNGALEANRRADLRVRLPRGYYAMEDPRRARAEEARAKKK